MKIAVARVCGDEERARASDEFAGLRQDLGSVKLNTCVARQSPLSAVEFTRLIDELLETRFDGLRDSQRFIGSSPEHPQEGRHYEHQQQQQRRDGRERLPAADSFEDPLIDGIAQPSEDGRQEDRQQKRADHRHERGGDGRDQQEKKGLAESGSLS